MSCTVSSPGCSSFSAKPSGMARFQKYKPLKNFSTGSLRTVYKRTGAVPREQYSNAGRPLSWYSVKLECSWGPSPQKGPPRHGKGGNSCVASSTDHSPPPAAATLLLPTLPPPLCLLLLLLPPPTETLDLSSSSWSPNSPLAAVVILRNAFRNAAKPSFAPPSISSSVKLPLSCEACSSDSASPFKACKACTRFASALQCRRMSSDTVPLPTLWNLTNKGRNLRASPGCVDVDCP
mmetsp:Transcript_47064/g.93167  ORF Transcript_47064/g.93167 Transcript_47064/m.93167 type:complete len:235 (-) Transcript_47064:313-1017(-)